MVFMLRLCLNCWVCLCQCNVSGLWGSVANIGLFSEDRIKDVAVSQADSVTGFLSPLLLVSFI